MTMPWSEPLLPLDSQRLPTKSKIKHSSLNSRSQFSFFFFFFLVILTFYFIFLQKAILFEYGIRRITFLIVQKVIVYLMCSAS